VVRHKPPLLVLFDQPTPEVDFIPALLEEESRAVDVGARP
jgi:hypothetical protein